MNSQLRKLATLVGLTLSLVFMRGGTFESAAPTKSDPFAVVNLFFSGVSVGRDAGANLSQTLGFSQPNSVVRGKIPGRYAVGTKPQVPLELRAFVPIVSFQPDGELPVELPPIAQEVWVPNYGEGTVGVLNTATNTVTTIPIPLLEGETPCSASGTTCPEGVVLDGGFAYVTLDQAARVVKIDTATHTVVGSISVAERGDPIIFKGPG